MDEQSVWGTFYMDRVLFDSMTTNPSHSWWHYLPTECGLQHQARTLTEAVYPPWTRSRIYHEASLIGNLIYRDDMLTFTSELILGSGKMYRNRSQRATSKVLWRYFLPPPTTFRDETLNKSLMLPYVFARCHSPWALTAMVTSSPRPMAHPRH